MCESRIKTSFILSMLFMFQTFSCLLMPLQNVVLIFVIVFFIVILLVFSVYFHKFLSLVFYFKVLITTLCLSSFQLNIWHGAVTFLHIFSLHSSLSIICLFFTFFFFPVIFQSPFPFFLPLSFLSILLLFLTEHSIFFSLSLSPLLSFPISCLAGHFSFVFSFLLAPWFVWFYTYRNILKCTKIEGNW